jgi:NAD(P)-dependent dehydrogenase (short-subunit alcohol dehydrogenase family)
MVSQPVAIVTGGSRGIGLAIVKRFLSDGYRVAAIDINDRAIGEARDVLGAAGDVRFYHISATDRPALVELASELMSDWGSIDALINNAGVNRPGNLRTQTDEQWDAVMETNLKGAFVPSAVFADHLAASGRGAIVNIGSTSASGSEGAPAYATSKAGLIGLTRTLAVELGPDNVRVNLVAPGITLTGWIKRNVQPEQIDAMEQLIPLGRAGEPEDIASVVAFMCSEDARHVTGQVISASGGSWMP